MPSGINLRTFLIDKEGKAWSAGDRKLHQLYQTPYDNGELADFLVRNAGFIRVLADGESCSIWFVPAAVNAVAFMVAGQQIDEHVRRVRLSWYDGAWNDELCVGRERALKRMLALMSQKRRDQTDRFLSVSTSISSAGLSEQHVGLLDLWRDSAGQVELLRHGETIHNVMNGKFVIVHREADSSRMVFSSIGKGVDVYVDNRWKKQSFGQRIEHQPDMQYGTWVANCYREAILANEPTLTKVDAIVSDPAQGRKRRMQYARLTLPLVTPDGETQLLSASVIDRSINLQLEVNQEAEHIVDQFNRR